MRKAHTYCACLGYTEHSTLGYYLLVLWVRTVVDKLGHCIEGVMVMVMVAVAVAVAKRRCRDATIPALHRQCLLLCVQFFPYECRCARYNRASLNAFVPLRQLSVIVYIKGAPTAPPDDRTINKLSSETSVNSCVVRKAWV